eukprot:1221818-Pleurochrysis_carterae.AAC.4
MRSCPDQSHCSCARRGCWRVFNCEVEHLGELEHGRSSGRAACTHRCACFLQPTWAWARACIRVTLCVPTPFPLAAPTPLSVHVSRAVSGEVDEGEAAAKAALAAASAAETVLGGQMLSPDAEEMERRMSGMALAEPPAPVSSVGETLHVSGTDRYFVPLRLACESKLPRIMEVGARARAHTRAHAHERTRTSARAHSHVRARAMLAMRTAAPTLRSDPPASWELRPILFTRAVRRPPCTRA